MAETRSRLERETGSANKTEIRERLQRWVEHFGEILNRDDTVNPVEENEITELEDKEMQRSGK